MTFYDIDNVSYACSENSCINESEFNHFGGIDPRIPQFYRAVIPIMLIFCIISIITNLVIVISVRWLRRNQTPTLYLSISLAAADAYASLVIGVGLIYNSLLIVGYDIDPGDYYKCIALVLEAFRMTGMIASVWHLLALAFTHYVGIIRPLHYRQYITHRCTKISISVMWLAPLVFFFTYYSGFNSEGFRSPMCYKIDFLVMSIYRIVVAILFFIPLTIMTFIYAHIFFIVHQLHRNDPQLQRNHNQVQCRKQLHRDVKAAVTTLLILGTYSIGWLPAIIFSLVTCIDCVHPYVEIPAYNVSQISFILNTLIIGKSFVDPIIYAARMKEIREALLRMSDKCLPCFRRQQRFRDDMSSSRSRNDTMATSVRLQSASSSRQQCTELINLVAQSKNSNSVTTNNSRKQEPQLIKENGC